MNAIKTLAWSSLFGGLFAFAAVCTALSPVRAEGAAPTFIVNSTLDKPDGAINDGKCTTPDSPTECTLRAAIMAANDLSGTTIHVPAGIYTLTLPPVYPWYVPSWFGHLEIVAPMTITGAGPDVTIIDGNRPVIGEAVFVISGTAVISGVTIQNGAGGIMHSGNLIVANTVITGHRYLYTAGTRPNDYACGGICSSGALTLTQSVVSNNVREVVDGSYGFTGFASGGGIQSRGDLYIVGSTISGNTVKATGGQGAGIANWIGRMTLADSAVLSNTITCLPQSDVFQCSGGGVMTGGAAITRSTISGNTGGGLFTSGGTVVASTIGNNARTGHGAGIYFYGGSGCCSDGGILTIVNSTVSGNVASTAASRGGGIYSQAGDSFCNRIGCTQPGLLNVISSTIANNSAGIGGGIFHTTGRAALHNTRVSSNIADSGGGLAGFSPSPIQSSAATRAAEWMAAAH